MQAARETMQELIVEVSGKMAETEVWLDEQHSHFKDDLSKGSTALGEAALALLAEISGSALNDPDSFVEVSSSHTHRCKSWGQDPHR